MIKKLNEETTYSASVTMNDGEGNKTASINTDDYNELARFLQLSGIKAPGNNSSSLPSTHGEGWADDNPMNMDAAGYETGGDTMDIEVEMPDEEMPCDEMVDSDQADYDYGHVPDRPRPYSIDVYDYKGRAETDTDKQNFRRVNRYGDNALPKTEEEELNRLLQLSGAPAYKITKVSEKDVEEGLTTASFKALDKFSKMGKDNEVDDEEMDEARARGPNSREDTMLDRLDRNSDSRKPKYQPKDEEDPNDKYASMAKKYGVEEAKARGPNHREDTMLARLDKKSSSRKPKFQPRDEKDPNDKYASMAKKYGVKEDSSIKLLQDKIEEELNSFLNNRG